MRWWGKAGYRGGWIDRDGGREGGCGLDVTRLWDRGRLFNFLFFVVVVIVMQRGTLMLPNHAAMHE
jgi:hypothetical protein